MAAKITKRQAETARAAIKTTQLMKRLQSHAMGELELTATQIRAAEIVLKKTMPDLKSTEHSGEVEMTQRLVIHG